MRKIEAFHLNVGVLFLKILPCTCDGTTGTNPRNKAIDFTISAFPNLRSSCLIVDLELDSPKFNNRQKHIHKNH